MTDQPKMVAEEPVEVQDDEPIIRVMSSDEVNALRRAQRLSLIASNRLTLFMNSGSTSQTNIDDHFKELETLEKNEQQFVSGFRKLLLPCITHIPRDWLIEDAPDSIEWNDADKLDYLKSSKDREIVRRCMGKHLYDEDLDARPVVKDISLRRTREIGNANRRVIVASDMLDTFTASGNLDVERLGELEDSLARYERQLRSTLAECVVDVPEACLADGHPKKIDWSKGDSLGWLQQHQFIWLQRYGLGIISDTNSKN